MRVYVGTYTQTTSKGVQLVELDETVGRLSDPQLAAETKQPSYVALHPSKKFLYAIGETAEFGGKKTGSTHAFAVQADGTLRELNAESSGGSGPAYIEVDRSGKAALVANYGAGSVAMLPISADGMLGEPSSIIQHSGSGPFKGRQEGPHAHSIIPDPSGKYALACDLGIDAVIVYRVANNQLVEASRLQIQPGSGPRMVQFADDCSRVYLVNELNNTVCQLQFDSDAGTLKHVQTISTLPADFTGSSKAAAIGIHPSQKFLYASNRGHDSLAKFTLDAAGRMTPAGFTPCGGKSPRHFAISPSGKFLLCGHEQSDSMALFEIAADGQLTPKQTIAIGQPVCIVFA